MVKSEKGIIEKIADLEHRRWVDSAKTLLKEEKISLKRKSRWKKYLIPYSKLDEKVKDLDRVFARKILKMIKRELKIE